MASDDIKMEFSADLAGLKGAFKQLFDEIKSEAKQVGDALDKGIFLQKAGFEEVASSAKKAGLGIGEAAAVAFATWEIGKDIIEGVIHVFHELFKEVKEWVTLAIEADQADAQLAQSIKSAGREAEFTQKGLAELAHELQGLTNINENVIKSVQSMTLRFSEVKGDQFKELTQLVLDMSVKMKTDATSAAVILGRALEDPGRALEGLSRAGIKFNDSQRELIKHFKLTGETAEAQRIILKEMEKAFGGTAVAAANAAGGGLKQISIIFEELKRDLGKELLPLIDALVPAVKFLAEEFATAVKKMASDLAELVNAWAGSFDTTPAETMVGAVAILRNEVEKLIDSVWKVSAGWRSIALWAKESDVRIGEVFGGGFGGTGFSEAEAKNAKARQDRVTDPEQLKILQSMQSAEEKQAILAYEALLEARRQDAKDSARLNEPQEFKSSAEVAKEAIIALRENVLAHKENTARLEAVKVELQAARVPGESEMAFSRAFPKFNPRNAAGNMDLSALIPGLKVASGTAENLIPGWAKEITHSLESIIGGSNSPLQKVQDSLATIKGFFTGKAEGVFKGLLNLAADNMTKEKPETARIENFQTLFQRIQTAAGSRGDTPEKKIEQHTKKTAEKVEHISNFTEKMFGLTEQQLLWMKQHPPNPVTKLK